CVRAHGNAIEYLSIGLILLLLVEMNQTQPLLVHSFGIALLVGRVMHAVGLSRSSGPSFGRVGGMILTLTVLGCMAALLIWQFVLRLTV
ncbi:MAG: MAPEG family protein, partial [Xanthomonadales bacterium]|nr:MAPEG family protein [Xanthomonadales bacterium]